MRKIIFLILFIFPLVINSQITFNFRGVVTKKISPSLVPGTEVELIEIFKPEGQVYSYALVKVNNSMIRIFTSELSNIEFKSSCLRDFWTIEALKGSVYENFITKGFQYKLRNDIEEDALAYLTQLERDNLVFNDSYLKDYLYTLLNKVYPEPLNDGRQSNLNIIIIKDKRPNASVLPNGTLFITTGLLTIVKSEDELIAVLAHEVSHFVLDHAIININKEARRRENAEFWSTLLTGVAAMTDVYLSVKNEYYYPGAVTEATAILSYTISSAIIERLGLNFSKLQETNADYCAMRLLDQINIKPNALSTVLNNIKNYCVLTGDYLSLTDEGNHPSIDWRISNIGEPSFIDDSNYDKKISLVITYNAIIEFNSKHFLSCYSLVNRNMHSNMATEEDYVLFAMTNLCLYNTETKNLECLNALTKAESLNVYPTLNLFKQKALVLLRLNKNEEAIKSLENYKIKLQEENKKLNETKNTDMWTYLYAYLNSESEWTLKMLNKIKKI